MTMTTKAALAALLASALAAPAMAADWRYHGGPKSPDSLSGPSYGDQDYGSYAYAGEGVYAGGPYAYAGGPYYAEPAPGWYGSRYRYRHAPATSDYYHGSRMLQGTR
jgi:hypothetical protein